MSILVKMSNLLPVVLFIVGRWVFDTYSPSINDFAKIILIDSSPRITNWQVFYYIMLNLAWVVYLWSNIIAEIKHSYKLFYKILVVYFLLDIIINTLKIGMDFAQYVVSITNLEQNILMIGLVTGFLVVFLFSLLNIKH